MAYLTCRPPLYHGSPFSAWYKAKLGVNSRFVAMKHGQKATVVGMVLQHDPGCLWVVYCGGDVPKAVHWILQNLACRPYSMRLSSRCVSRGLRTQKTASAATCCCHMKCCCHRLNACTSLADDNTYQCMVHNQHRGNARMHIWVAVMLMDL